MGKRTLQQARVDAVALLAQAKVTRVICVDDEYESTPLPGVIGALDAHSGEQAVVELAHAWLEIDLVLPDDFWKLDLQKRWDQLTPDERTAFAKALAGVTGIPIPEQPTAFMVSLGELIDSVKLDPMSPSAWETYLNSVCPLPATADTAEMKTTLVLFDLNLHLAPGYERKDGLQLATEFIDRVGVHTALCTIISNGYGIGQEEAASKARATAGRREQLMFLAKDRLMQEPETFVKQLKRALVKPIVAEIFGFAERAVDDAHKQAAANLHEIDPFEVGHALFRTNKEGQWELDTVRRFYDVEFRDAIRRRERATPELPELADRLRGLWDAAPEVRPTQQPDLRGVDQREWYETAATLAEYHLPLALGDVFRWPNPEGGADLEYVLLAQPCDLMIRSGGTRTLKYGVLAPIDHKKPSREDFEYSFPLKHYNGEAGPDAWVMFKVTACVPLCILDLCVFSSTGEAKWTTDQQPPSVMHGAMRKGLTSLENDVTAFIKSRQPPPPDAAPAKTASTTAPAITASWFESTAFGGELLKDATGLRYNCQRTRRIREPMAAGMLTRYAACLARAAFDMTLSADK